MTQALEEADFHLSARSLTSVGYAKFRSRSHDAVISVYDEAGNVIDTHEHKGEFKEV
jgi:hypothetical protein